MTNMRMKKDGSPWGQLANVVMLFVLNHLTLQTLWMMIIIGCSFSIRKNDTVVVLSIICRFTTVVHRAEQDLSVFLWWRFNCSEDWSLVILISFICLPGLQCKSYGRWHCLIKRWTPFNWQLWIVPIIGVWCLKLVFLFCILTRSYVVSPHATI